MSVFLPTYLDYGPFLNDIGMRTHTRQRDHAHCKQLNYFHDEIESSRALELRVQEMWLHSTRVMLGEEAAFDDFGEAVTEDVGDWMEGLEDVELPFLQAFNCWRHFPEHFERLARCPRLAATAAQLLGVDRVRLYQDSLFLKRPGDGSTRWHSDLHMVSRLVRQAGRQAGTAGTAVSQSVSQSVRH